MIRPTVPASGSGSSLSGGSLAGSSTSAVGAGGAAAGMQGMAATDAANDGMPSWRPVTGTAKAKFPFEGTGEQQLALAARDRVAVKEMSRCNKWYRGEHSVSGKMGIFPVAFVEMEGTSFGSGGDDSGVEKLDGVLVEWGGELREYYRELRMTDFQSLKERVITLINARRKIVSQEINEVEKQSLLRQTLDRVEDMKRLMGLDMVVKNAEGVPADETNTGINELLDMHVGLALRDQLLAEQEEGEGAGAAAAAKKKTATTATTSRYRRLRKKREQASVVAEQPKPDKQPVQLTLAFKSLTPHSGEEVQLLFQLYSRRDKNFVSETFVVQLASTGTVDTSKGGKSMGLFADLLAGDMSQMILVCRVVRMGKLIEESGKDKGKKADKKSVASSSAGRKEVLYRRPAMLGLLVLTDSVFSAKGDTLIPLYKWKGNEEANFAALHEAIVRNDSTMFEVLGDSAGVSVAINRYPLALSDVLVQYPVTAQSTQCIKYAMPETFSISDQRNDLYVTLDMADLPDLGSNTVVEITVSPRNSAGRLLPNCFAMSTGEKPRTIFKSWVVLHTTAPTWKETLRVFMPKDQFKDAHLHFELSAKETKESKKKVAADKEAFGYTFMRLTNSNGTVVANGEHSLSIYKNPTKIGDPNFYLKDPGEALLRRNNKLVVRTLLSSAVLTQTENVVQLINWRTATDSLESLLKKVTFIEPMEIIKFLREIFDAMFEILDERSELATAVYDALVFIIGILVDEKASQFSNFRSVLDTYGEHHFKGKLAHKALMQRLQFYLSKMDSASHAKHIRDSMKALEYIFRFIVSSRILYQQQVAVTEADANEFKDGLMKCLEAFNLLMSQTSPALIGAQTLALKNFSAMLHDLSKIYDIADVAKVACAFLTSIPPGESKKQLNQEKLNLIHELLCGAFFTTAEARTELMPTVLNLLSQHMERNEEELVQSVDILGTMLDTVQYRFTPEEQPLATWELVPLLPQLMQAIISYPAENYDFLKIVTCALSFFHLMEPYMFDQYIEYLEDREGYIMESFQLCDLVLRRGFPSNWFVMQMFLYATLAKFVGVLSRHLNVSFSEEIWKLYFGVLLRIVSADALQIERLPALKRQQVEGKYGDMRPVMAGQLLEMYEMVREQAGEEHGTLVDAVSSYLVEPAFDMMQLKCEAVSAAGLSLYLTILKTEYQRTKSITNIVTKTTDNIHKLIEADDSTLLNSVFLPSVEKEFGSHEEEAFRNEGSEFLKEVGIQVELLSDLRNLPADSAYDDERVNATMRLMNHLLAKQKFDAYVRYVHLLTSQHLAAKNYSEAAMTLCLHTKLLTWSDEICDSLQVESFMSFPCEPMHDRKERLVRATVDLFDKAKDWERAAAELVKMEEFYVERFRYKQLAELLKTRAQFCTSILETERFFPEFFRVGYYGRGFAASIANQEFVYRGYELERLSDFTERIKSRFPGSELLKSTDRPGPDVTESPGMYLLITPVQPSDEFEMNRQPKPSQSVPGFARKYQKHANVCVFSYSRVQKTDGPKGVNEFADMWLRRQFLVTHDTFPSYSRSSRVEHTSEFLCSPVENAVEAIESKTVELFEFIEKHSGEKRLNLGPMTMALTGVLDAAVNGGVSRYSEAFVNAEFLAQNPDAAPHVEALRQALRRQLSALQAGVVLHRQLVSEDMRGLQDHMETMLVKMKSTINEVLALQLTNDQQQQAVPIAQAQQ